MLSRPDRRSGQTAASAECRFCLSSQADTTCATSESKVPCQFPRAKYIDTGPFKAG